MDTTDKTTRRRFLAAAGSTAAATALFTPSAHGAPQILKDPGKPALLGGTPVRKGGWPAWPQADAADEQVIKQALNEKAWCLLFKGAHFCKDFEQEFSRDYNAHTFLTGAGTSALHACMYAVGVGPGDEVIMPADSFIATMQVALTHFALPIFVDIDPETGLIDPAKIEQAISPKTRVILPVHLNGAACDMDAIMAIARKHNLKVVEDACQAPYVEWDGKKLGTIGDCGGLSFNVWKTLGCGEGGMMITSHEDVARCLEAYRNNGRDPKPEKGAQGFLGMNLRPTEFQGALLVTQLQRFKKQAPVRQANAAYLADGWKQIPGIKPLRMYPKMSHHNYYVYFLNYDPDAMSGLTAEQFSKAISAEGIGIGANTHAGLMTHHRGLDAMLQSRYYKAIYTPEQLRRCEASRACETSQRALRSMLRMGNNVLLGTRQDMDLILEAAHKVYKNAALLAKA